LSSELGTLGSELGTLSPELGTLEAMPLPVPAFDLLSKEEVERAIYSLCAVAAQTAYELAKHLGRNPRYLKNHYLKTMQKTGRLKLLYPDKPNHPHQAYLAEPQ
jgi:hypothetical protein